MLQVLLSNTQVACESIVYITWIYCVEHMSPMCVQCEYLRLQHSGNLVFNTQVHESQMSNTTLNVFIKSHAHESATWHLNYMC